MLDNHLKKQNGLKQEDNPKKEDCILHLLMERWHKVGKKDLSIWTFRAFWRFWAYWAFLIISKLKKKMASEYFEPGQERAEMSPAVKIFSLYQEFASPSSYVWADLDTCTWYNKAASGCSFVHIVFLS